MSDTLAAKSMRAESPAPVESGQETDVWWGSYSGWTMLPSLLLCVALTGAIVLGAWRFVERRNLQWTIWSLAGAVWLVQGARWGTRVFGHNYRLTSRRLFIQRGHLWQRRSAIGMDQVQQVKVQPSPLGRWTQVGRIVIVPADGAAPLVLEGVRHPEQVAERLRALCAATAERAPLAAPATVRDS